MSAVSAISAVVYSKEGLHFWSGDNMFFLRLLRENLVLKMEFNVRVPKIDHKVFQTVGTFRNRI